MRFWVRAFPLALSLSASGAAAQPAPAENLAESLFEEGKRLMEAGDHAQACPKLAESQRLDPRGGTLLNLALCHEKQGKTATAWTEFKAALSVARRDGRADRALAAEEHIAALERVVPRLTIVVAASAAGQVVAIDGATLGAAAWGTPVALDPGAHELVSTAPGRREWRGTVVIGAGERQNLTIPALALAPDQAPVVRSALPLETADKAPGDGRDARRTTRTVGWAVGGAGVAALGVGAFFGLRALSKRGESDDHCESDTTCTDEGVALNEDAKTAAWVSNVGFGLGLAAVAVGGYLVFGAGSSASSSGKRVTVAAGSSGRSGGVTVATIW